MPTPARTRGLNALGLVLLLLCAGAARGQAPSTPEMPRIDAARYAGLWHELARTPNRHQDNTPSRAGQTYSTCRRTTATYTLRDDGSIALRNVCVRTSPQGSLFEDVAEGIATVDADSGGSRLKIAFGGTLARFFQRVVSLGGFPYWIYRVGESAPNEPYRWAIVSGPDRDFLFLLTRERHPAPALREEILAAAHAAALPVDPLVFAQD
jgi:apolipoprotein D and lipocalin family protein